MVSATHCVCNQVFRQFVLSAVISENVYDENNSRDTNFLLHEVITFQTVSLIAERGKQKKEKKLKLKLRVATTATLES